MKYSKKEEALIKKNQKLSYKEIVELIKKELDITRTVTGIRKKWESMGLKAKGRTYEKKTVVVEEDKPKFYVSKKDKVKWEYKHGVIEIDLGTLDQIFYEYSKHGLNLTQTRIQNKHGLTAIQWQSLKRTFDLVKDSDVFTHVSLERHDPETQCQMIADKIAEKYSAKNMRAIVEYEDTKQRGRAYEKAIKKAAMLDHRRQMFETELFDYVSKAKAVTVKTTKGKTLIDEAVCHICDLHIGADIEEEHNLPAYNVDVISKKLSQVAEETNAKNAKRVTVFINGDLIETFTGLSHINSWKNIDKKYGYGVKATIKAVEIISEFLSKVNNLHEVVIVAGNHDRVTSNNKEDVTGEVVQWIHYTLEAKFGHLFKLDWASDVSTRVIGGICYIVTHGHLALSKKPSAEIINQYGVHGMFCIILEGHWHTRKIKNDGLNYRHLTCPSIFTGNDYSKNLGFNTKSGFLFIYASEGYPIVIDYPIH